MSHGESDPLEWRTDRCLWQSILFAALRRAISGFSHLKLDDSGTETFMTSRQFNVDWTFFITVLDVDHPVNIEWPSNIELSAARHTKLDSDFDLESRIPKWPASLFLIAPTRLRVTRVSAFTFPSRLSFRCRSRVSRLGIVFVIEINAATAPAGRCTRGNRGVPPIADPLNVVLALFRFPLSS
jgi:hypothetical protein